MQLNRALVDYYRSPEEFLDFELKSPLSSDEGFFRFGSTICYGRSCSGRRYSKVSAELDNVLSDVSIRDSKAILPFNPSEVINNFRLERYIRRGLTYRWAKSAFYALRPWLSTGTRTLIKKIQLVGWQKIPFPTWPVDCTVENICEQILLLSLQAHKVDRIPIVWFWPRGARGCIMMTHDVETAAGRDVCGELMDLDESCGLKAAFEIVPEERYEITQEFLDAIKHRGFEVAIQDLNHDGKLFDRHDEFLCRASKINRYAKKYGANAFRSAVLFRRPEWQAALQFSSDMSIPNVAHLDPQRGGCCTVTPYFIGNAVELPVTTTQDYMIVHLLGSHSVDLWKTQTMMILEKSGLVSFIVHPDYVINDDQRRLYKDLLAYLQDLRSSNHLWFALPHEIERWWRLRSKMTLVSNGESWQVRGEGSEEAVVAYAVNNSGKLTYSIPS